MPKAQHKPKPAAKPVSKPVQSIVKKRNYLVPILAVVIIIAVAVAIFFYSKMSHPANVLATVNGEPIYQETVDQAYATYQGQYSKDYLLNQTIDKTLLLQEAKRRGLSVSDAEITAQINTILAQFGITNTDLDKILTAQNMTLDQYKVYVKEQLMLTKVLNDSITSRVSVSDQEVGDYYDSHAADFTAPPGGVIVSHILVDNLSTAQDIVKKLDQGAVFADLAAQYSIDNGSKLQGGYLGIVTNATQFVPEFLNASLSLKPQQYTRTPVKTVYGYHIIIRDDDKEPLSMVRPQIESTLQTQKQIALFQQFLQDLRSKATIKYYTQQGTVTQKSTVNSLDTFAKCVAGKATLYGTTWSQFFQQQQALFGTSFTYLNFVDCDKEPQQCSDASVQKYPTWIIGNQTYGQLSLQDLSTDTGCVLPQ